MKHLSRLKKPRANSPGSAFVQFEIGDMGELVFLNIQTSSGASKFDRQALKLIRKAVPFPKPPTDVNRIFAVEIKGR